MRKYWTPFFYSPEAAAGAGGEQPPPAGDKTPPVVEPPPAGEKTPEQIAADKKVTDDAAAAAVEAAKAKTPPANETPEQKTAREAKEKLDADAAAKVSQAPEKYELKVGKDAETFIDASDLKVIEKFARDKGLTNDQAQSLLNDRAGALLEQSVAFRAITEADSEYGGDKLSETQRLAKIGLDKLRPAGTPRGDGLRQILTKTGYGNNLEIVSLLADIGKAMAEDTPGGLGSGAAQKSKDAASVLYDNPTSKTTEA